MLSHRGNEHGRALARALAEHGRALFATVTVAGPPAFTNLRRTLFAEGAAITARCAVRHVAQSLFQAVAGDDYESRHETCACRVPSLAGDRTNGPRTRSVLGALRPDLLLLGGCGIVREPILRIPRLGVLNAHPGWLPDYRGTNVVAWSLHNGETPGATVHWANQGIDTGDIILRRRLPNEDCATLDEYETAVTNLAAELLADAVDLIAAGRDTRTSQDTSAGHTWPRMSATQRRAVAAALDHRTLAAGACR